MCPCDITTTCNTSWLHKIVIPFLYSILTYSRNHTSVISFFCASAVEYNVVTSWQFFNFPVTIEHSNLNSFTPSLIYWKTLNVMALCINNNYSQQMQYDDRKNPTKCADWNTTKHQIVILKLQYFHWWYTMRNLFWSIHEMCLIEKNLLDIVSNICCTKLHAIFMKPFHSPALPTDSIQSSPQTKFSDLISVLYYAVPTDYWLDTLSLIRAGVGLRLKVRATVGQSSEGLGATFGQPFWLNKKTIRVSGLLTQENQDEMPKRFNHRELVPTILLTS